MPEPLMNLATKVKPRARLVDVPQWNQQVEIRSLSLGDRINYRAHVVVETMFERTSDMADHYPALLIPAIFSPARAKDGAWLAGRSDRHLFRWSDFARVNAQPDHLLEGLAGHVVELSGMMKGEETESFMRLTRDGDLRLLFEIGAKVANSGKWPDWYEGNEFRAVRDASAKSRAAEEK